MITQKVYTQACGPGSSVTIVTGYGLDGPGIESRWEARFLTPVQTGPGAHPASCTMGTGSFPGGKERPGRDAEPSPPSSAVVIKGKSYASTPPMGRTACTEPQCLYKDDLYFIHKTACVKNVVKCKGMCVTLASLNFRVPLTFRHRALH
jgi:hypothetical protein